MNCEQGTLRVLLRREGSLAGVIQSTSGQIEANPGPSARVKKPL